LLPDFQFGFRKSRSTITAATVLYEAIYQRLTSKPKSSKTYVCFVDFAKCFDSVRRDLLFTKLQKLGFPTVLCELLHFIYANTKFFIRSGIHLVEAFETSIGLPQGCCLSPILFCLFVHDLPDFLTHNGIPFHSFYLKYLQFADDLALIANSPTDLQMALCSLEQYCNANYLNINVDKTKIMVFYMGSQQRQIFYLGGKEVEQVTSFTYLGVTYTTQLSFTKHVENLNAKASSKCGILLSKLPNFDLPPFIILDLFNCYILPTYRYGLSLWFGRTSEAVMIALDSVFTKFLKRYLGIPYRSNNSITHFITGTEPLSIILQNMYLQSFNSLSFPSCMNGFKLNHSNGTPHIYDPLPLIPTYFWHSKYPGYLPTYSHSRKLLCKEMYDLYHHEYCTNVVFHVHPENECKCLNCGKPVTAYHMYFCAN